MILTQEEVLGKRWENKSICKECGGICCQRNACEASPADFDNNIEKMEEALKSGKYAIDLGREDTLQVFKELPDGSLTLDLDVLIKSDEDALYIRPRNQNRPIVDIIHFEDIEGPCIFWTKERGCELKYEERPKFGRAIVPVAPGYCKNVFYTKNLILQEWHPWAEQLYRLAQQYFDANWFLYQECKFKM